MNYGQRQPQLSAAIAAALRRLAYAFGGQEWDKLSRPYGRLGTQWDGQDAFWGFVGKKSGPFIFKEEKKEKGKNMKHSHVKRWVPRRGVGYGQGMVMWELSFCIVLNCGVHDHVLGHVSI
ncbi:hypothetical protein TorRG33x02_239180 [Trema orientale]|uniref:Uncharacterized protein n=1 Tax=Trema orientale TaxID=63057 RepID=A0A2P5DXP8_TREOI|nr:hypothetical protein TorRG33x02_239180 [Trema orientale]